MSEEQTMYVESEDDVTTVRERLRQATSKHIILVIPPQSQLRSHLTWRLLYARARELGKDVLVVSTDPQIRSLAHGVKFRVAHSLESSSQAGKSRPASRGGRSVPGKSRTPGGARPGSTREASGSRDSRPIKSISGTSTRGADPSRTSRPIPPPSPIPPAETDDSAWYMGPGSGPANRASEIPPIEDLGSDDIPGGPLPSHTSSSLFGPPPALSETPTKSQRNKTSSPIFPLPPDIIDEPDPLFEDYHQAQDIRQAATQGRKRTERTNPTPTSPGAEHTTSHPHLGNDPLAYLEDSQPPPRSEQLGGVAMEGFHISDPGIEEIPEVEYVPTTVIESTIEYRGDQDEHVPPPTPYPITAGVDLDDEALPSIDERPTQAVPPGRSRRSTPLPPQVQPPASRTSKPLPPASRPAQRNSGPVSRQRAPERTSKPLAPGAPGNRPTQSQRPAATPAAASASQSNRALQARPPAQPASRVGRTGTNPLPGTGARPPQSRVVTSGSRTSTGANRPPAPRPKRTGNNRRAIIWMVVAAVLACGLVLAYLYIPTATVTLTVKTESVHRTINAKAALEQTGKPRPAFVATRTSKPFVKTGQGTATGERSVGTQAATGSVTFTNLGTKNIIVPSGTIVATSTNPAITFTTTAEGLIQSLDNAHPDANTLSMPVTASAQGVGGNVDAGTITAIPEDSLQKIAEYQTPALKATDVKLTVTNIDKTTGGGAQLKKAITNNDLTQARDKLAGQAQNDINNWLKTLAQNGYAGTPQTSSTLINPPPVNQVAEDGTFQATVQVTVTVLYVKNADLRNEAIKQLNTFMSGDQKLKNFRVLEGKASGIKIEKIKQNGNDPNTLNLTFDATAQAGPNLPTQQIQDSIIGQSLTDAHKTLNDLRNQGVVKADIQVSPGFFPRLPSLTDHITLIFQPETQNSSPPGKK